MEFIEPLGPAKAFAIAELFVAAEPQYTIYAKAVSTECRNKPMAHNVLFSKNVEIEITAQTIHDCVETLERHVEKYQIREIRVSCRHDTPEREGLYICNIYPEERKVQIHGIGPDGLFEALYEFCLAHGMPSIQWCAW